MFELSREEVASVESFRPDERRVSIVADGERGREALRSITNGLDCRVLFDGDFAEAVRRASEGYPFGDIVMLDVEHDDEPALPALLDRLHLLTEAGTGRVLVSCAPESLDLVFGALGDTEATIMCRAGESDWLAALALSGGPLPVLQEAATEDSLRLQRLADEVDRIARTLADLAGNTPLPPRGVSDALIGFRAEPAGYRPPLDTINAADVRGMIRLRRLRDRYFRGDLFADPAWDMLLDLMAARLERIRVAVSSLCIAAAVPPTTALRWIKTMTESGLFVRVADPEDGRRVYIELSSGAAAAMTSYLAAIKAQGGVAV